MYGPDTNLGRTDGLVVGRTDERTDNPATICSPEFFREA